MKICNNKNANSSDINDINLYYLSFISDKTTTFAPDKTFLS